MRQSLTIPKRFSPPLPLPRLQLPSAPGPTATVQNTRLTLLPQLWLSLLHRAKNHVASGRSGQTVQAGTSAIGLNDEEGLGTAVVCTVKDGTGRQTEGHAELVTGGTDDWITSWRA